MGAVLHRADRGGQGRPRRKDDPGPGGPHPTPASRRRIDQERRPDRQGEHPQQPAPGDQPVRNYRHLCQPLRRHGARQRPPDGPRRSQAPGRRHPRGVQPDRPLPARQLLVRVGFVRVRAAVRHHKRHAHEVLQQHRSGPAPRREGRREAGTQDLEQLCLHELVGRRDQQADRGPHRLRQDLLRQAHPSERPHPVLRADRGSDAARDAPVPDRGDRADPTAHRGRLQLQAVGHRRRRWVRVAHHRVRQDAHQLQDRPAGQRASHSRQGALRRRPQGPRLPDHAGVRPLSEGCGQLQHIDEDPQEAAGRSRRSDHYHDDPEAQYLHHR